MASSIPAEEVLCLGHGWQTQARGPNPASTLFHPPQHLISSISSVSAELTVKEQSHVYSPKVTLGPLKATARLMWPLVKMSLTPLEAHLSLQVFDSFRIK